MANDATTATTTDEAAPLYQRGCKITAGARAGPPPPSWRLAKMLVLAQRASLRILQPAAATLIQKAWTRALAERARTREAAVTTIGRAWLRHRTVVREAAAAVTLQTAARRHLAQQRRERLLEELERLMAETLAAVTLQAAARRRRAAALRRRCLAAVLPPLALLQARARGMAARRRLQAAAAAARRVQACWRMVRAGVVRRRLAGAAARLRRGVELAKYRAHGVRHERRGVLVFLSDDLQQLMWTCAASGKTHSVPMAAVSAVSAGVKTARLKAQERRCEGRGGGLVGALGEYLAPSLPLDEERALSLLTAERTLDLVAPSRAARDAFLRDARTLLTYAHHLDHARGLAALRAGVRRGSLAETHAPVRAAPRAAAADAPHHDRRHLHRASVAAAAA